MSALNSSDFSGFFLAHIVDDGSGYSLYIAAKGSRVPKSQRFVADVTDIVGGVRNGTYSVCTAAELICDVAHLADCKRTPFTTVCSPHRLNDI